MAIAQVAIGNTDTILLTVPASTSYAITTIMVVNPNSYDATGTNDSSFDMHFVKNAEAKSNINMVVKELPVPGGETFTFDSEKIILEAGDKIVLLGAHNPSRLSATVSFMEV